MAKFKGAPDSELDRGFLCEVGCKGTYSVNKIGR